MIKKEKKFTISNFSNEELGGRNYLMQTIEGNDDSKLAKPNPKVATLIDDSKLAKPNPKVATLILDLLKKFGMVISDENGENKLKLDKDYISSSINKEIVPSLKDIKFTEEGVEIRGQKISSSDYPEIGNFKDLLINELNEAVKKISAITDSKKSITNQEKNSSEFLENVKDDKTGLDLLRSFADALNIKGLEKISKKGTDEQLVTGIIEAAIKYIGGDSKIDGKLTEKEAAQIEQQVAALINKAGVNVTPNSQGSSITK
jgi:hypothetical protein